MGEQRQCKGIARLRGCDEGRRRRKGRREKERGGRRVGSIIRYMKSYVMNYGERVSEYPGKKEVRSNEVIGSKLPGLSGLSRLSGVVLLLYCIVVIVGLV